MFELWRHQIEVFDRAKNHYGYALFCEVGTGKTAIAIKLIDFHLVRHVLIVCPKSVRHAWLGEFTKFAPQLADRVQMITGTRQKRAKLIKDKWQTIHVMNFETVVSMFGLLPDYKMVVIDESHYVKNHKTKRSKVLSKIAEHADYKYLLTGTPITNSLMDLYSQFYILDQGETLTNSYWVFRNKYFEDKNSAWRSDKKYFPNWQPKANAAEDILSKVAKKSSSLLKEDCLDLPPKIYQRLTTEMTAGQRKAYTQMALSYVAYIEGEACVASIALTKLLRCQQISNGFFVNDKEKVTLFDQNPKMDALEEYIESYANLHKIIVWANHIPNLEAIYERLLKKGYNPSRLYGKNNHSDNIGRFLDTDSSRVFVVNPASGGSGITLCAASINIYYSNSFNYTHREQSEGRTHRIGSEQHSKITYLDIVNTNSIDETILDALKSKRDLATMALSITRKDLGV